VSKNIPEKENQNKCPTSKSLEAQSSYKLPGITTKETKNLPYVFHRSKTYILGKHLGNNYNFRIFPNFFAK